MGFLRSLARGLAQACFAVGSFLIRVGEEVKSVLEEVRSSKAAPEQSQPDRAKPLVFRELHEINVELCDLESKESRDRRLSSSDFDQRQLLLDKRNELYREHEAQKAEEVVAMVQADPDSFDAFGLTDDTAHIPQYYIGQTVLGKTCPSCGRPMRLYSRGTGSSIRPVISLGDLFWQCIGYYSGDCRRIDTLAARDSKMLARTDCPEFDCTNPQLGTIFTKFEEDVAKRVDEHVREAVDDYLCPIHKLPLVLRRKRDGRGILDTYFLGCPMWKGRAASSCQHILKLKSPAQLAAFLQRTEGRGVL